MPKKAKQETPDEKALRLAKKALRAAKSRESGGLAYKRSDRLVQELLQEVGVEKPIELNANGRKAIIHDEFVDKAGEPKCIVWNPCAARRYKLEIIEP